MFLLAIGIFFLPSLQATKSMSIRLSATPGFWGGWSFHPALQVFCGPRNMFSCLLVGQEGERKQKEKKKENHFVLCLINFV